MDQKQSRPSRSPREAANQTVAATSAANAEELTASGRKRRQRQPVQVEQRTPSKRQKLQHSPFQSPIDMSATPRNRNQDNELLYKKGKFLAVRNESGGFYLCQAQQFIYKTTKSFKVRWLSLSKPPDVYKFDFYDSTEFECIITTVRMENVTRETHRLPEREKQRTEFILQKALNIENGIQVDLTETFEEAMEKQEPSNGTTDTKVESTPVKPTVTKATTPPTKPTINRATKGKKTKGWKKKAVTPPASPPKTSPKSTRSKKAKLPARKTGTSPGKGKHEKTPSGRKVKDPNAGLTPRTNIRILEKDPFYESRENVPVVSSLISSKLLFRAVKLNDMKLLQKLIDDVEHVSNVNVHYSIHEKVTPLEMAVHLENHKAIDILCKAMKDERKRVGPPSNILATPSTGIYNPASLGIPKIRPLNTARGSREGNMALTKDDTDPSEPDDSSLVYSALEKRISKDTLDVLLAQLPNGESLYMDYVVETWIVDVIRTGNRKLAAALVEDAIRAGLGFNFLHTKVLQSEQYSTEGLLPAKVPSVKKKPYNNDGVTPIHCACINPNTTYLETLLSILPEYNIMDKKHWRPIHYAAACEGSGPLSFLLKRRVNTDEVGTLGNTPLMIACTNGRHLNVDVLLKSAQADLAASPTQKSTPVDDRFGLGGVHKMDKSGRCPIHMAAEHGHLEVIRTLLKYGADINKAASAARHKMNALQIAAARGDLPMVQFLVQSGAVVEFKDRFKHTALMHAVMNNHNNVTSYLLHIGASPDLADSSGNTSIHYAAAYGSYFCLKSLLDADGDPNKATDWKLTPIGIAFLKGNTGLLEMLLSQPGVDINFKNDEGMTLLMLAAGSPLEEDLLEQVEYLIKEQKADCAVLDINQNNVLHHLAINHVGFGTSEKVVKAKAISLKVAELFVEAGCSTTQTNTEGKTPTMLALYTGNAGLVKLLMENGGSVSTSIDSNGWNVLHHMAHQCTSADMMQLLETLMQQKLELEEKKDGSFNSLKDMTKIVDHQGYTPLLRACQEYCEFRPRTKLSPKEIAHGLDCAREFMKGMIDLMGADVNAIVGEKYLNNQPVPPKEQDRYDAKGKMSAVHVLIKHNAFEQDPADKLSRPGLQMILRYHPKLDTYSIHSGHTPLIDAIEAKNHTEALLLIEAGASVNMCSLNEKNDGKASPLIFAIKANLPNVVHALVAKGANVNCRDCRNNNSPLHYAVGSTTIGSEDCISILKSLIDSRAVIDCVNDKIRTPLHIAVNVNSGGTDTPTDVIEYLVKRGADLSTKDVRGRLPLHYVFVQIKKHTDFSSIDPIELCGAVTMNMKPCDFDVVDIYEQTPLHRAALRGSMVCCMHLLQRKADINKKDKNGNTPLGLSVLAGHKSCAVALIQKDANINIDVIQSKVKDGPPSDILFPQKQVESSPIKDGKPKKLEHKRWLWKPLKQSDTTYHRALSLFQTIIQSEWQGVTYILLDQLQHMGISLISCMESALRVNKYNLAIRLMKKVNDDVELTGPAINADRQNLLHVLAFSSTTADRKSQMKVAEYLCNRGIKVTAKDKHGCTPLTYAALKHNEELVDLIIGKSIDGVTEIDNYGRTPLAAAFWDIKSQKRSKDRYAHDSKNENEQRIADEKCAVNIAKKLIMKGANLDILCDYPFERADVFDSVCECVFSRDYHQKTGSVRVSPLISAIRWRSFPLVRMLLDLGAGANFADETKMTPIMHAVKQNDIEIVKLLFNHSYSKSGSLTMRRSSSASIGVRRFMLKKAKSILSADPSDKKVEIVKPEELDDDDIDLNFESFQKVSNVDVNTSDEQGWTVIHHLVCPLDYGTYDNVELLRLLVDNGASMNAKDRNANGMAALDYAIIKGASNLAKGLQKLAGVKKEDWDKPSLEPLGVTESMPPNGRVYNFQADAESLLQQLASNQMEIDQTLPLVKPDPSSGMEKTGEVVTDADQGLQYDAVLVKVDVAQRHHGVYVYYKLQVIHQLGKDMFFLLTHWGRMGDDRGQFQQTPFPAKEDAIKEFHKVFKEKTGNDWNNIKSFKDHPKKYRLVQREDQVPGVKLEKVEISLNSDIPSILPEHIQELLKHMTNVSMLSKALQHFNVDEEYMPFGKIKKEALVKAREILEHIKPLHEKVQHHRDRSQFLLPKDHQQICEEIAKLSNEYYHLVPSSNYMYTKLQPLNSDGLIQQEVRKITNLLELELAGNMILAAQYRKKETNPLDYIYQCMGCTIQLMSEDEPNVQYILKYIDSSMPGAVVESIYRVSRHGESERLQKCGRNNRHLLWHGSSSANLLSILTRGLLISPPHAGLTGAMFGKGIYLADTFSKSSSYCSNYNDDSKTQFMLLCEAALGKVNDCKQPLDDESEKPTGTFDSIKGMGRQGPDPVFDVTLKSGAVVPIGKIIKTSEIRKTKREKKTSNENHENYGYYVFNNNEFVVFDESQVCLRYLIQFKSGDKQSDDSNTSGTDDDDEEVEDEDEEDVVDDVEDDVEEDDHGSDGN